MLVKADSSVNRVAQVPVASMSFWNLPQLTLSAKQINVIDTESGEIRPMTISPVAEREVKIDGSARQCRCYRAAGKTTSILCYDIDGDLVRAEFEDGGHKIVEMLTGNFSRYP